MTIKVLQSGEITDYLEALTTQVTGQDVEVQAQVSAIIEQVRTEGDAALLSLSQKFDGVSLQLTTFRQPINRWNQKHWLH